MLIRDSWDTGIPDLEEKNRPRWLGSHGVNIHYQRKARHSLVCSKSTFVRRAPWLRATSLG
jgi:hypothetical protein